MSFFGDIESFVGKHVGDAVGLLPVPGASSVGKGVQSIVNGLLTGDKPSVSVHEAAHAKADVSSATDALRLKTKNPPAGFFPAVAVSPSRSEGDAVFEAFISRLSRG